MMEMKLKWMVAIIVNINVKANVKSAKKEFALSVYKVII